jgi:hypothetical protein
VTRRLDNLQLLDQDEIWIDRYGVEYRLVEMNQHHRACLLPFLERQMLTLWLAASDEFPHTPGPTRQWFYGKPLVCRLLEFEAERTAIDRLGTRVRNRTYPIRRRLGLTDG